MSDQTIAALERIRDHAASVNADVERVEVSLSTIDGKVHVEFTARLTPKPLLQTQVCTSYIQGGE
jgi:hypothetical protein